MLQLSGSVSDPQPGRKKIILVEVYATNTLRVLLMFRNDKFKQDIPNAFYRRPDTLWPILRYTWQLHCVSFLLLKSVCCRKFHQTGRCPLVFIVSDSARGDSGVTKLFPRHVQTGLEMDIIKYV